MRKFSSSSSSSRSLDGLCAAAWAAVRRLALAGLANFRLSLLFRLTRFDSLFRSVVHFVSFHHPLDTRTCTNNTSQRRTNNNNNHAPQPVDHLQVRTRAPRLGFSPRCFPRDLGATAKSGDSTSYSSLRLGCPVRWLVPTETLLRPRARRRVPEPGPLRRSSASEGLPVWRASLGVGPSA